VTFRTGKKRDELGPIRLVKSVETKKSFVWEVHVAMNFSTSAPKRCVLMCFDDGQSH